MEEWGELRLRAGLFRQWCVQQARRAGLVKAGWGCISAEKWGLLAVV